MTAHRRRLRHVSGKIDGNQFKFLSPKNLRLFERGIVNLCRAERHECNLCGYRGRFLPFGRPPRKGVACGGCGSKERHRLLGLWLAANEEIVAGRDVLHFAPEHAVARLVRGSAGEYRSADIEPGRADLQLNIERLNLPDSSVDVVVCSHVLEHVDDVKALNELHRILRPGGTALLMFPVVEGWDRTYENPAHVTPRDREVYYGQSDHVRFFGRDVRDRIISAGFVLAEYTAVEPHVARYGLNRGEKVFTATKPT